MAIWVLKDAKYNLFIIYLTIRKTPHFREGFRINGV